MADYLGMVAADMGYEAHLTVMFFGRIDRERHDYVQQVLRSAYPESNSSPVIHVLRKSIKSFGRDNDIPVVTVHNNEVLQHVRNILKEYGIEDFSEYGYQPHITMRPWMPGVIHIPDVITLSDMYVSREGTHYPVWT